MLDTHVFVWSQLSPNRLSDRAKVIIGDAESVWVSAICFFEIAQKARLGKWPEVTDVIDDLPAVHQAQGGRVALLDAEICRYAGFLHWPHRDPFDRLIAATALRRNLMLVSADAAFDPVLRRAW